MRTLSLLLALLALPAAAQTQETLFPGQSGAQLLSSIRAEYRPSSVSGDNDDLYATVDRATVDGQDGVIGVYTGYFVPFDCTPSCDPSQDVFNNSAGINQEHTWPNSLLTGIADNDLHNLFPTQVRVNADRGTLRFAESPDAQTDLWYRGGPPYTQTSIPAADIDEYSEIRTGQSFEPREDHKGNVARALFYMDAVYDTQTSGTFPFDQAQRDVLYDWHYADPITAADQARSARVAQFQSGKDNPFVLDSTLVRRAFFPGIVLADDAARGVTSAALRLVGQHPFRDAARLELRVPRAAEARVEVLDALGRRVSVLHDGAVAAGALALRVDGAALAPGVYLVSARLGGDVAEPADRPAIARSPASGG